VRRIVLTGLLVVGGISTSMKLVLSMLVCIGCIKLYGYNAVFDDDMLNSDAELAQFQVFFILFLTLLIQRDVIDNSVVSDVIYSLVFFGPVLLLSFRAAHEMLYGRKDKIDRLVEKYVNNSHAGASSTTNRNSIIEKENQNNWEIDSPSQEQDDGLQLQVSSTLNIETEENKFGVEEMSLMSTGSSDISNVDFDWDSYTRSPVRGTWTLLGYSYSTGDADDIPKASIRRAGSMPL